MIAYNYLIRKGVKASTIVEPLGELLVASMLGGARLQGCPVEREKCRAQFQSIIHSLRYNVYLEVPSAQPHARGIALSLQTWGLTMHLLLMDLLHERLVS